MACPGQIQQTAIPRMHRNAHRAACEQCMFRPWTFCPWFTQDSYCVVIVIPFSLALLQDIFNKNTSKKRTYFRGFFGHVVIVSCRYLLSASGQEPLRRSRMVFEGKCNKPTNKLPRKLYVCNWFWSFLQTRALTEQVQVDDVEGDEVIIFCHSVLLKKTSFRWNY
jgi:hypothetical protein